eukprot:m.65483 g.65483  ORF g.65483 m.65483 type:complete len:1368 (+) comp11739_c0_seq1:318-4421(+)
MGRGSGPNRGGGAKARQDKREKKQQNRENKPGGGRGDRSRDGGRGRGRGGRGRGRGRGRRGDSHQDMPAPPRAQKVLQMSSSMQDRIKAALEDQGIEFEKVVNQNLKGKRVNSNEGTLERKPKEHQPLEDEEIEVGLEVCVPQLPILIEDPLTRNLCVLGIQPTLAAEIAHNEECGNIADALHKLYTITEIFQESTGTDSLEENLEERATEAEVLKDIYLDNFVWHDAASAWELRTDFVYTRKKGTGEEDGDGNMIVTKMEHEEGVGMRAPCKFFLEGNCRFGEKCKNSHAIPNSEEKQMDKTHPIYANVNHIQNLAQVDNRCILKVHFGNNSRYPLHEPPVITFQNLSMSRKRQLEVTFGIMKQAVELWQDNGGPILYQLMLWLDTDEFLELTKNGTKLPAILEETKPSQIKENAVEHDGDDQKLAQTFTQSQPETVKDTTDLKSQGNIPTQPLHPMTTFNQSSNGDIVSTKESSSNSLLDDHSYGAKEGTKNKFMSKTTRELQDDAINALSDRMRRMLSEKRTTKGFIKMLKQRRELPSFTRMQEILDTLGNTQVLVISGATGCGKTTQIPQFILDSMILEGNGGRCDIICTQPRRISAIGVAQRVADERQEDIGDTVGYQIRLESKRSKHTRLLFCTTGILLRRLESDPDLAGVSHIVVDEVHERSLESDFLLMVLKDMVARRPSLKVVLMSATINEKLFSDYFGGPASCPIIRIPGRSFPVTGFFLEDALEITKYIVDDKSDFAIKKSQRSKTGQDNNQQDTPDYSLSTQELKKRYPKYSKWTLAALQACDFEKVNTDLALSLLAWICSPKQQEETPGAVLVFLPGIAEISKLHNDITTSPLFKGVIALPLHSSLTGEEQARVFVKPPKGTCKVVLATNIAETSITIEDVVWVVDGGRVKETQYDPGKKMSSLVDSWVSQAGALQRRGRAGRVRPGKCFHLVTSHRWKQLQEHQTPEIFRVPLEQISLRIKTLPSLEAECIKKAELIHTNPNKKAAPKGVLSVLANVIEPPKIKAVKSSLEALVAMDALDVDERLTPLGHHLASLPVDARIGKLMVFGAMFSCVDPILTIAACLSYRSPFVTPFGRMEEADEKKKQYTADQSDHLAMLRCYEAWMDLGLSVKEQIAYCNENFLSHKTFMMLGDIKRQYAELLSDIGFLHHGLTVKRVEAVGKNVAYSTGRNVDGVLEATGESANINSRDTDLIKAVLCAALFPNIVVADFPPGGARSKDEVRYRTAKDGKVSLHPSSVCYSSTKYKSPYLIYLEKVKTSQIYIRDVTPVPPYVLLLFGSHLQVKATEHSVVVASKDALMQVHVANVTVATLIQELQRALTRILQEKIRNPKMEVSSSPVISVIIDIIEETSLY